MVPAVPLLRALLKAKSTAVMERVLFPVLTAAAMESVPVPLSSVSASKVVAPAEVNELLIVIPSLAFSVIAPGVVMPPVVALNVIELAETVLLLTTNPLVPVKDREPCPVIVPPL